LTDRMFDRSDSALRRTGYMSLIDALGCADAIRFLVQISPGQGDYLEWQDRVLADMSVDELYDQARRHRQSVHE